MKLLIFLIIISNTAVFASSLKGYDSSEDAANSILAPLKQGSKAVDGAFSGIKGINGDRYSSLGTSLKSEIKENGKVVKMKEVDSYSRLNGMHKKVLYELEYANGKKRQVMMELIQPADNAGFHIMKMELE